MSQTGGLAERVGRGGGYIADSIVILVVFVLGDVSSEKLKGDILNYFK